MDASTLFARNILDVNYADLPKNVVDETKKQILDFIGVATGGYGEAGAKDIRELAVEWGGTGQATIIGSGERVPAPNAAQVNSTMAHSLDFDDVHEAAIMHPGVVTIPTALAVGEYTGKLSGRDLIQAVAVGGDMICRMGLATRPGDDVHQYGWHFSTLNGFMTSAAVSSRIMGLSEDETVCAIGIGYHQSCGNGQAVTDGVLTKRLGPGFAVRGGIHAAMLASRGVTGARNAIEGIKGYYKVYHGGCYSRDVLVGDLGTRFESGNTSIKPYPSCRGTHTTADAALELVRDYGIEPENVEGITIWCGKGTLGLLGEPAEFKTKPRNYVDSQFSLAWVCATAIARKRVVLDSFTTEAIQDAQILDIAAKVKVIYDAKYDTGGLEPVRIEVKLKDGEAHTVEMLTATGSPDRPVTFDGCIEKFHGCAAFSKRPMPQGRANAIISAVSDLENMESISDLIKLLVW